MCVVDGQSVLLVCVPEFNRSHSCVLVSLGSLNCWEIKFNTTMDVTCGEFEIVAGYEEHPSILRSFLQSVDDEDFSCIFDDN